jgi:GT2 family glycosyltransferase
VTVAIPSHARAARLRALLDGLEQQTFPAERFEVVVCHDYEDDEGRALIARRVAASGGRLREVPIAYGTGGPALQRNRAWRAGSGELVAFIDDDCRPSPQWLEELVRAARASPGAIVEGATRPDPEEEHLLVYPHSRSLEVHPPGPWAQTANILYPRSLLERVGGFDEEAFTTAGEDTDLMLRATAAGARHVGASEALVWHAVDRGSVLGRLRSLPRWANVVLVARRHPRIRAQMAHRFFWKSSHEGFLLLLLGVALAVRTRRPWGLALALPWWRIRGRPYGLAPRAIAASARDSGGRLVVDGAEVAVMVRGSLRHRTLVL